jgi:hypothetical protein
MQQDSAKSKKWIFKNQEFYAYFRSEGKFKKNYTKKDNPQKNCIAQKILL